MCLRPCETQSAHIKAEAQARVLRSFPAVLLFAGSVQVAHSRLEGITNPLSAKALALECLSTVDAVT